MQVYILTEGGSKYGLGHIMRCSALYQAFFIKGIKPLMIVDGDKGAEAALEGKNYLIRNWKTEPLPFEKDDLVIIDSYQAPEEVYYEIAQKIKLLVCLDDTARINYPPGIVLNSLIDAEKLYSPVPKVKYLLGTNYALLREPFQQHFVKAIQPQIKNVMVTLGGQDHLNLMPKIIEHMQVFYPQFLLTAVIGNNFKNRTDIEKIKGKNTVLIDSPDGKKMAELMVNSDIAISAGGQTLLELARTGTPSIAIGIAENQIYQIEGLDKTGVTCGITFFYKEGVNYTLLFKEIDRCMGILADINKRKTMSQKGQRLIDGKGSIRAVEAILDSYKF